MTPPRDAAATSLASANGAGVIRIRGARVHNLRGVDVDLPRNRLVVITGVSGSGKSSLAFDTLLAEGQRQYVDSLSVYSRQFFDQRERPDVDRIEGLQPAVAIDQSQGSHSPRSTVGTVTEVHDYLRLLYARAGEMACAECGEPISQQPPGDIERARKAGFVRVRVDGLTYPIEDVPELKAQKPHDVEAVVDRVVIREGIEARVAESVRLAVKHGEGVVQLVYQTPEEKARLNGESASNGAAAAYNADHGWRERLYNTRYACPTCKTGVAEVEPRTFSFNSPHGACPECDGIGVLEGFDPELVLPDRSLSLAGGAVAPWRAATAAARKKRLAALEPLLGSLGVDAATPLADWPDGAVEALARGANGHSGVCDALEEEFAATTREATRDRLAEFRGVTPCAACGGSRLRPEARSCRVGGLPIHELSALSIADAAAWFARFEAGLDGLDERRRAVAEPLVREIGRRLAFLEKTGVGYLTLDRAAATLSGGELQRVRLATGVGSGLVGVMYLLDEPSIGLHPRDNDRLIAALRDLQRRGNTVIVVEHDEALIRSADWLVDVGPGAGERGGRIVAVGSPSEVAAEEGSVTGGYLAGRSRIETPAERRAKPGDEPPAPLLTLRGATLHNLRGDELRAPLKKLVCVTGVSGSGKTSLIVGTLAKALARELNGAAAKPGPYEKLTGVKRIDRFVEVDQSPIGRSPRSNAATYTGVFDEIRKLFAKTKLARQRGYKSGRFSFNVKGGRCEECQGQGQRKIEMNFLPDLYVTCEACRGARFNRQTLAVEYRGRSIADVLDGPVDAALEVFADTPAIHGPLEALSAVGLGYLTLGQPATTLSGGEAQRIKLAAELGGGSRTGAARGHALYLLDEPTTGLHVDDVRRLLGVLNRLVDAGNTVLVIEHHLDVIRSADWVIDMGPEGGEPSDGHPGGGRIVAAGTPEQVAACEASITGRWLREALADG